MIVMKFGGTSVGGYEEILRVVQIVQSKLEKNPVVLTSAMSKMTDLLYRIAENASLKQEEEMQQMLEKFRNHHVEVSERLLTGNIDLMLDTTSRINEMCDKLENFCKAVCALGELSPRSKAIIVSNGELLSSTIVASVMKANGMKTQWLDARNMVKTDANNLKAEPNMAATECCVQEVIADVAPDTDVIITQGFIASSLDGEPTVLGRGGSDYSASLIGMALNADAIEIWTDVNGVLTADPRKVPTAQPIEKISFEEAAEMAHFGAKVLHPLTIEPAIKKNIPIYVLNSKNPEEKGTSIMEEKYIEDGVKSISYKENIRVINIFSTKMIDVSGFLGNVFSIFSKYNISVDLISTSEANISVTVDSTQNIDAVIAELQSFANIEVDSDKAQISVVGKNIINEPDLMEHIFVSLHGEKVYMVSQGASLVNLSIVINKDVMTEALNAIHDAFFSVK